MIPSPSPVFQFFKPDGTPAAGYKLYTYLAATTTPANTYQDASGSTLHTNPIELDVNGSASIFINPSVAYKYILKTAADAVVDTWDNIQSYNPASIINYTQETVVLSSGVASITGTMVLVDTEAAAPADDLSTLNKASATAGDIIYISAASSARVVTVKHGTSANNIATKSGQDYALAPGNWMMLRYSGSAWTEVEFSISKETIESKLTGLLTSHIHPFGALRNRFINGYFQVWQRGESSLTVTSSKTYTADRWFAIATGANVTAARVNYYAESSAVGKSGLMITGATSNTACNIGQDIESVMVSDLAGEIVTVSGELFRTDSGSVTWEARYANSIDTFSATTLISTGTVTCPAGSWQSFSFNFTVPAAYAHYGVEVLFKFGALVSGKQAGIKAMRFDMGSIDIGADQRPIPIEEHLCSRYFQWVKINQELYPYANAVLGVPYNWRPMRVAPTLASVSTDPDATPTYNNVSSSGWQSDTITKSGALYLMTATNTSSSMYIRGYRSSADAEL